MAGLWSPSFPCILFLPIHQSVKYNGWNSSLIPAYSQEAKICSGKLKEVPYEGASFIFVLLFYADNLGSFLQETAEIPLAVQLKKIPLYTLKKNQTCKPLSTEGQIHLFCLVREGYNRAFPEQGRGLGVAELLLPLCSSMVLFQWVWHLGQLGLFCWLGTERQMKLHNTSGRLLLPQAWMKQSPSVSQRDATVLDCPSCLWS